MLYGSRSSSLDRAVASQHKTAQGSSITYSFNDAAPSHSSQQQYSQEGLEGKENVHYLPDLPTLPPVMDCLEVPELPIPTSVNNIYNPAANHQQFYYQQYSYQSPLSNQASPILTYSNEHVVNNNIPKLQHPDPHSTYNGNINDFPSTMTSSERQNGSKKRNPGEKEPFLRSLNWKC